MKLWRKLHSHIGDAFRNVRQFEPYVHGGVRDGTYRVGDVEHPLGLAWNRWDWDSRYHRDYELRMSLEEAENLLAQLQSCVNDVRQRRRKEVDADMAVLRERIDKLEQTETDDEEAA
jgi:hypothetical protein